MNDFHYAFRQLLRQPGFTILAVVALALGIGANTVLFSAINTLFFRPLAYPEPKQLVRVWGSFPERGLDQANVSWPRFSAWRDQQQSFSDFAAQAFTGFTLTGRGDPENLQGIRVTSNFLPTLGVVHGGDSPDRAEIRGGHRNGAERAEQTRSRSAHHPAEHDE